MQETAKKIFRASGRYSLIFTRTFVRILPYFVFRFFYHILVIFGWPILISKRKLARENLQFAFGQEKSAEQINEIARKCFKNFARGMIDLIYFIDRRDAIRNHVRFEGRDHIERALAQGKGVIIVSAHYGNFILMYLRMIEEGYKTNVIMKRTRDAAFERYISEFRDERGLKTIYDLPARKCVQDCLRALRNNEILFILLDQNYGGDGRVFVDFFGRDAATATGPVVFANRTGAPILPMFIMTDDAGDRHKLVIEGPVELEKDPDDQKATVKSVAKITKIIERYVRMYPYEWGGWMHKRWKSRTVEEQIEMDKLRQEQQNKKTFA